ncbi:nucleolar protein 10-like [Durio zibethinus]|uniref:Nucleolar protein 10-like n=1 Tax=Durio zibethinus TaxID=66656 RepID=A0A6P5Z4Y9_DURZI|nr:nucleolar protein 10-like [Durio zibethinus]
MGRDITYDCWSCDLLCAASSPDLYKINLEQFGSSIGTSFIEQVHHVNGEGMTSIEPAAGTIIDIRVLKESGLMVLALDGSQIPAYFIRALGPFPKWCSSLDLCWNL